MVINNWINVEHDYCSLDFTNLKILNKKDSIDYTIEMLTNNYDNLYLSLSGGIDSEFVANCLLERGIKFTPVIVDFKLNSIELWYAYYWCRINNITPKVITVPFDDLFEKFPLIAKKYNVSFISALDFIVEEYVSDRGGHLLNSSACPFDREDCFDDRLTNKINPLLEIDSFDFGIDLEFPNKHPSSFLMYTPEMFYSLISSLDYQKPIQLALLEFYDIIPRPKIPYILNVSLNSRISALAPETNSQLNLNTFCIGNKDDVIESCRNKKIIECRTVRKGVVNV